MLPDVLDGAGIVLRPFRFSDVSEFHSYINEPDMSLYLEGTRTSLSEADAAEIIARHLLLDKEQRQVWAVTVDDEVVGAVSINFAKAHRVSEIGYSIKKSLWGQGMASRATQAVVNAAFEAYPQLQRIQANIHPDNGGSIRVAKSVGMEFEGTLRSYAFVRGKAADEAVYAIVRQAWTVAT